jgi:pyruvate/2-oxoglutarate dehydrogenase complex dihydrolipoamide dehydrogenase (E3) component
MEAAAVVIGSLVQGLQLAAAIPSIDSRGLVIERGNRLLPWPE